MTMGAFEVEEVRKIGAEIEGPVIVGEILEINAHPNASKIRLTRVKVDESEAPLEIVCGAQNIEVGHIIPVALPGARVLNRHDGSALHIKAAPIRGVMSNGMLCSPSELGISGFDVDGILILSDHPEIVPDEKLKLGEDIKKALGLVADWVLHVGSRSNRGDALSVAGLAREVAALTGRPLKSAGWALPAGGRSKNAPHALHVESNEDCPLFTIREIENLKVGPSPREITRRLEAIGIRPVNNIVDITNYVMHELGQPLHAYDTRHVNGRLFEVRRAKEKEALETIDGKTRKLTGEMLVIADEKGALGAAGIMGGKLSEIGDDTTAVALEAASFEPSRVRRGSRLLGLSSESSLRFERGVDFMGVIKASDRASYLILKHCADTEGSARYGEMSIAGNIEFTPPAIKTRLGQIKRLLDIDLPAQEIERLLKPLGFDTKKSEAEKEQSISVLVPSFRTRDVTREIDVIEEVARLYGYDRLPAAMPSQSGAPEPAGDEEAVARRALSACGLSEAWTSSLVRSESRSSSANTNGEGDRFGLSQLEDENRLVEVLNPLSDEHQVLRQSLVPGLVRAALYNQDRGRRDVFLFELGRVYNRRAKGVAPPGSRPDSAVSPVDQADTGVEESHKIAGILMGKRSMSEWQNEAGKGAEKEDFFRAKGVVETLVSSLRVDLDRIRFFSTSGKIGCLHPYRSAEIIYTQNPFEKNTDSPSTTKLGFVGQLNPGLCDALGLQQQAQVFEIDLDALKKLKQEATFKAVPTTPYVVRDLTVDVAQSIDHASVKSTIRASAGKFLTDSALVSVFRLSDELKSLSYRLTFQDPESTLTNEQVEERLDKIRESLKSRLGASFRV